MLRIQIFWSAFSERSNVQDLRESILNIIFILSFYECISPETKNQSLLFLQKEQVLLHSVCLTVWINLKIQYDSQYEAHDNDCIENSHFVILYTLQSNQLQYI